MVQLCIEIRLVLCLVSDSRHIDGHHAHGAGALAGAEESACFLAQLPEVQAETAAHAADIAGLHVAVDVVGKVRRSVLGCHLKQKTVVLCIRPVKIIGNGVSGNGVLESASIGIAFNHGFNERLVNQVHLLLAVFILKVHLPAAHDGIHLCHVVRNRPVQGDVGEGSLGAPAAGGVHSVDKGLNALLYLGVA